MTDSALFIIGLIVSIPAGTVVVALVFAAGIDERAEKKRVRQAEPSTTQRV